jgi:hypothetical protein
MDRSTRQTMFFVLVFLIFFLGIKLQGYWIDNGDYDPTVTSIMVGCIYTLIIMSLYYLAQLNCSEGFWDVTEAAKCKGGPYMWQGDSETAKMCRQMASTPDGNCKINAYNCDKGFNGVPRLPFQYSVLSDDNYQNERCNDNPSCDCANTPMRT